MHVEPLQASTGFYPDFTLPRIRSSGFGSRPCDFWPFKTTSLTARSRCGPVAFATASLIDRLTSPQKHTPWLVILNGRYNIEMPYQSDTTRFQVFSLPVKGTFQRSLAVLYAIGLWSYLRLEVDAPRLPVSFPRDSTHDTFTPFFPTHTGLSPSVVLRSRRLVVEKKR